MKDVIKAAVEELKRKHDVIRKVNDENAYMLWILFVPDEPTEEDFIDIVSDPESLEEVNNLFDRILEIYGDDVE